LVDAVFVAGLPVGPAILPVGLTVVSQWRRNAEPGASLEERILLEHPDGTRFPVANPNVVDLQQRHLYTTTIFVPEIPLRGYGQYWFVVQRRDAAFPQWSDATPTAGLWVAVSRNAPRAP
jgi:hypothetical protein